MAGAGKLTPVWGVGFVLAYQSAIVGMGQTAPVLAPLAAGEIGVDAANVGYFTAIVFGVALFSSNGVSGLMARLGSFKGSALSLVTAALGVACVALAESVWGVVFGAVLIGVAYGPVNPLGSRILMRIAPARRRNLLFSIKQSSVSIGGAAAGAVLPAIALGFGWRAAVAATGLFAVTVAVLAFPTRSALGDDAEPSASIRFVGPLRIAAAVIAQPELRSVAAAAFSFSMMQFGFMSIYVTLLWSWLDLAPAMAAAMLSISLVASIAGRIFWGWRADGGNPPLILLGLAWCGAASLMLMLLMSPEWPLLATALFSAVLGFGAMSWSGVLLSEVARIGVARDSATGTLKATSATMVFAYLGGLLGPAMLSLSAAVFGGYGAGVAIIAAFMAATGIALAPNVRKTKEMRDDG
ncbi:MFS transporter [Pikeienuella sp. HZG-20]|uniref:MFS transporter n=1 Tax=Paludibacillus litoralis TaxID=3133267 RepID=UPI0030EC3E1D